MESGPFWKSKWSAGSASVTNTLPSPVRSAHTKSPEAGIEPESPITGPTALLKPFAPSAGYSPRSRNQPAMSLPRALLQRPSTEHEPLY